VPDDLPLQFEFITPAAPVQAEGTVDGRPFYFRARHEEWELVVAERAGADPAALGVADAAAGDAWYRSGVVDGRSAASFLTRAQAEALIQECARAYLIARAS
jgi:hypothetical protein